MLLIGSIRQSTTIISTCCNGTSCSIHVLRTWIILASFYHSSTGSRWNIRFVRNDSLAISWRGGGVYIHKTNVNVFSKLQCEAKKSINIDYKSNIYIFIGYVSYDLIHFYLHYGSPSEGTYFYHMKRYHNHHHFTQHESGLYGTQSF